MWRYLLMGLGLCASFVTAAGSMSGRSSHQASAVTLSVEEQIAAEAQRMAPRKGETRGHNKLVDVYAKGKKLVFEYELALSPQQVNTTAGADELRAKVTPEACKMPMLAALKKGASIEFNFRTQRTKQFLFEVRVTESSCFS